MHFRRQHLQTQVAIGQTLSEHSGAPDQTIFLRGYALIY